MTSSCRKHMQWNKSTMNKYYRILSHGNSHTNEMFTLKSFLLVLLPLNTLSFWSQESWHSVSLIQQSCLHQVVFRLNQSSHDDVIKWKHFPRYWPFVRVNSPHKGQWRGALMFTLICARINGWANNCKAGDLRRNHAHYDVIVVTKFHRLFPSRL